MPVADLHSYFCRPTNQFYLNSESLIQDIIGSTAILKPNQPGSTKIKLSWIWQVSARNILLYARQDPDDMAKYHNTDADDHPSILECMSYSFHF